MTMPPAEIEVTAGLVRELLAAQHPDLAARPLAELANGWDNVLYRLGDDLIVRLPRRQLSAELVRHEQRWLPELAPRLPLSIPAPVRIGTPDANYPWPWSVVPFLPGEPAAVAPPRRPAEAAQALGSFLRHLHQEAPPDAPANPFRGVPLSARADGDRRNLDRLGDRVDRDAVLRVWAEAPPGGGQRTWVHGDLHPLNILVHDGLLTSVIDFGDLTAGDPAVDLGIAWMLFAEPGDRDAFYQTYGADDATRARAKGWAMAFAVVFLAHSADNPLMDAIGRRAYTNLMAR